MIFSKDEILEMLINNRNKARNYLKQCLMDSKFDNNLTNIELPVTEKSIDEVELKIEDFRKCQERLERFNKIDAQILEISMTGKDGKYKVYDGLDICSK